MKVFDDVNKLKEELRSLDGSLGFVPTMGFLHEGHLSLVRESRKNNDYTTVSIYVNPTQFGPGEDLDSYPRDLERDMELLRAEGVDYLFTPSDKMMYPEGYGTYVEVQTDLVDKLCGAKRPGHFRGVTTIVSKLFGIVRPDNAYFGMKDAQQVSVIQKMVNDLNMDVNVVPCPIVREEDGLAMSSRNKYLDENQRKEALVLSKSIWKATEMLKSGADVQDVKSEMVDIIGGAESSRIDYISIVDMDTLEDIERFEGKALVAIAVFIGSTRLIDNNLVEV